MSESCPATGTLQRPARDAVTTVGTVLRQHGSRCQCRLRPHRIGGSRRQPRPLQLRDRPVNSHLHDARVKANGRDQDAEKDSEEKRGQEARRIRRHSTRVRNNPSKSATGDQYRNYSRDDRPDNTPEKYDDAPTERKTSPDHREMSDSRRYLRHPEKNLDHKWFLSILDLHQYPDLFSLRVDGQFLFSLP